MTEPTDNGDHAVDAAGAYPVEWLRDARPKLYEGLSDERFHLDIEDAIEECWDGGPDPAEGKPITVHEWTTHPASHHLPKVGYVLDWLVEWTSENGEIDEEACYHWEKAAEQEDVRAAAKALLDLIGSKVSYLMADDLVATWTFPSGTVDAPPDVMDGVRTPAQSGRQAAEDPEDAGP
jgi:hypothetical protein